MLPLLVHTTRHARQLLATLTILLSACGGGGSPQTTDASASAASSPSEPGHRVVQSVARSSEAQAQLLTVRAHANLAGDIGALMAVRIDGTEIGQIEVRSTLPADYSFAAPTLKPGSQVDVVYTNDASVNGVDRNLYVTQISTAETAVLPSSSIVSLDKGSGDGAFDGQNVVAGTTHLYSNGALRMAWPSPNLSDRITVRASATSAGGNGALMVARVDGFVVGSTIVASSEPADYTFAAPVLTPGSRVDVAFANAGTVDGVTRSLRVHYLISGTTVLQPSAGSMSFDAGSGLAAFDGANVQQTAQNQLTTDGALRGKWPAANMTDTLTVRASARLAANVGPIVQVRVDGVVLGTVELRSTTPADISLPTLPVKPGQRVEVVYTNDATIGTEDRDLQLAYAIAGKTVLLASNNTLYAPWPEPNLTDTLNVRARGSLAAGVGPIMQVLVDDVLVGSAEVNSTVFADYRFPVPPMTAGRKVELVFPNDAVINGEDRNLVVAYLTTGNTVVLPAASGNVFDRGAGIAAFDNNDVVAASAYLSSNGALRAIWPAANITDTVTVRASATAAGGDGALMTLWVDGVAISAALVSSSTPLDFLMPTTRLAAGSKVAVTFGNPGTVDGVARSLNVHYLIAGSTFVTPTSSGVTYADGNLSGSWPQPNLTDTLNIRAYADVAGGVGAMMAVRVDGIKVDEFEVKSTLPQDHAVAAPKLKPGSQVDVVFTNDATVNGADRNLHVLQLNHDSTAFVPGDTNSQVDRGTGTSAFDGQDVVPGRTGIISNGALRLTWPAPNLTSRITVRASAQSAGGVAPTMVVRVDGTVVGTIIVGATQPTDFHFAAPAFAAGSKVDVAFTNAGSADGATRTLNVHYLLAGTTVLRPTDAGVKFDAGSGLVAYDGASQTSGLVSLTSNGALRGTWPAANMTDSLTVRATGTLLANVGPIVQILADGVLLGAAEVRSTTPQDITLPTLPLKPGQRIEVRATNAEAGRNLTIAYALSGKTVLLANTSSLDAPWPELNLTDTLNIRARGTPAAGVWPTMQVLVDGILIGTASVASAANADYRFAAPPMSAGRKLDIVYTNNAAGPFSSTEDRNLFIAYVTNANTVWLPNASGTVFDRGAGAAAFDGADLVTTGGSLYWDGALRGTWPSSNITDALTVRASATLAGNAGPLMILWVDGVAVSAVEVRSTTPVDYLMPTTALKAGSKVAVVFSNRGNVDGMERALNVQYLIGGRAYLTTTSNGVTYSNGDFSGTWPASNLTDTLTINASADSAGGVGALLQLRINGVIVATQEVRSSAPADYSFAVPTLKAGDRIDVVYVNDGSVGGADRNLYVRWVSVQGRTLTAFGGNTVFDAGSGEAAVDGVTASASSGALYVNGALRFTMPAADSTATAAQMAASRLLQQASFGPTPDAIARAVQLGRAGWISEQMSMGFTADMVPYVQARYDLGDAYRPGGAQYTPSWLSQRFWASAATAPDQLRRRVGFALHHMLMVSMTDSNLYSHTRAYAQYLDTLNRRAFGNYRDLLEEVALSPVMGIYLSHMRNRPESASTGRMPDENFARELMQLFSIGLLELNLDGSPKLDSSGQPIETYTNDDVMALAKVFTGYSWAFADNLLTENTFRWVSPDLSAANDQRIDLLRMKAYPGQHSTVEKRLFAGKSWAATLPAGSTAAADLKAALDTLFNHPNVGPFVSRQLIQHLVASNPSAAYVARVASVFNNNGLGVRGDLGAVVRAILMDDEATNPPAGHLGKLREPVLRVSHWLRSMGAISANGSYPIVSDLDGVGQRQFHAPSVFGYFRPGYVPPNTTLATLGATVPEMQIVNETSTAQWINLAQQLAGGGIGWNGVANDVSATLQPLVDLCLAGQSAALIDRLNLLFHAGRMSSTLKTDMLEAMVSVPGTDGTACVNRARAALFLTLASPEYLVQH